MSQLIKIVEGKYFLYRRKTWRYKGRIRHLDVLLREVKPHKEYHTEDYIKEKYTVQGLNCIKTVKHNIQQINDVLKTLNYPEVKWSVGIPDLFVYNEDKTWCSFIEVKSRNDGLRPKQFLWIVNNNVPVECQIHHEGHIHSFCITRGKIDVFALNDGYEKIFSYPETLTIPGVFSGSESVQEGGIPPQPFRPPETPKTRR
jgi:hypothetical protein